MKYTSIFLATLLLLSGCNNSSNSSSSGTVVDTSHSQNNSTNSNQTPTTTIPPITDSSKNSNPVSVGFYGSFGNQVEETKGFVNMHWETFWGGDEEGISRIQEAKLPTTIDVSSKLFLSGADVGLKEDAELQLRNFFIELKNRNLLQYIKAITPIDEPNLPEHRKSNSIHESIALIKKVSSEFVELQNVKIAIVFCTFEPMIGIELADIVYFDDYKIQRGADGEGNIDPAIKPGGWADQLDKILRPDQELGLIPGGSDIKYIAANITDYITKAKSMKRKVHIIAFLWRPPTGVKGLVGIVDNTNLKNQYITAFKNCV